jgi:hypothetical protein
MLMKQIRSQSSEFKRINDKEGIDGIHPVKLSITHNFGPVSSSGAFAKS